MSVVLPKLTMITVVFSPQIIENWRRNSAEGLSVVFIIIWLLGDFFNIFGAVLQGVLPTMTILAVYYTLADIVLLLQCFWYKGFTLRDVVHKPGDESAESGTPTSEDEPLLSDRHQTNGASYASVVANGHSNGNGNGNGNGFQPHISDIDRRHSHHSQSSFRERFLSIDGTHLSPVTPLHGDSNETHGIETRPQAQSTVQMVLFNLGTILLVMAAGVFGWWLSASNAPPSDNTPADSPESKPDFNLWGQIFGYICAALYLGSRIPQLLLNYRRKSTDGISMLFFLFACLGNLTYVLSIVVYKPRCKHDHCGKGEASAIYGRYIAINFSWLLGSFGTLILDACVFVQYFLYKKDEGSDSEDE
jgi:uncharacterized protein with PQ loop repeat